MKVIKEKSLKVENRNIGFGFIYFNEKGEYALKNLFIRKFKEMKRNLRDRMAKQKDVLDDDEFEELNNKCIEFHNHDQHPEVRQSEVDEQSKFYMLTGIRQWKFTRAPAPGDLNWDLFCTKSSVLNSMFSILLKIILLLLVVFCVSPISILSMSDTACTWLANKLGTENRVVQMIS